MASKQHIEVYINGAKKLDIQSERGGYKCEVSYGFLDHEVVGIMTIVREVYLKGYVERATYEPHFDIGEEFDSEKEEPL